MRRYAWWYGAGTAVLAMLVLWPLAAAAVSERTGETVAERGGGGGGDGRGGSW
ncbi:hypothetical protein [Nocardioides panzhihuensis]|uniref:Uncharacterized protein n=1 Tax=Nocardioides panzhihuensis TaxID=860243 RepID=A0A7Z0DLL9_9ACTN|nr:hypothetical protein [Nocardioides panzhihuensis]NYI77653.1 hypothetical protein [Nocardioides panzhihuensis]